MLPALELSHIVINDKTRDGQVIKTDIHCGLIHSERMIQGSDEKASEKKEAKKLKYIKTWASSAIVLVKYKYTSSDSEKSELFRVATEKKPGDHSVLCEWKLVVIFWVGLQTLKPIQQTAARQNNT